jgi:hypothetical protein
MLINKTIAPTFLKHLLFLLKIVEFEGTRIKIRLFTAILVWDLMSQRQENVHLSPISIVERKNTRNEDPFAVEATHVRNASL